MKILLVVLLSFSLVNICFAEPTKPKYISRLLFSLAGEIEFTLYNVDRSGGEFKCLNNSVFFIVDACSPSSSACLSAKNRIASMLLAANVSNRKIEVIKRQNCAVHSINLSPDLE